jgi:hypothetical protein
MTTRRPSGVSAPGTSNRSTFVRLDGNIVMLNGPIDSSSSVKIHLSSITAKPAVARAKYRPPNLIAGIATSAPTAPASSVIFFC